MQGIQHDVERELTKFMEEFKFISESDRAAVIIGAAKLDELLRQILQKVLKQPTVKNDDLLNGDAPLSTFSARIKMCERLGLIDHEFRRSLDIFRKIRNEFAHKLIGAQLDSEEHRNRLDEFMKPFKEDKSVSQLLNKYFVDNNISTEFRAIVALLCVRLEGLFNGAPMLAFNNPYQRLPPSLAPSPRLPEIQQLFAPPPSA